MADGILQVENLTKRYGGLIAVNDVSFNLMERRSSRSSAPMAPASRRCSS